MSYNRLYIIIDVVILVIYSILYFFLETIYKNLSSSEIIKLKTVFIFLVIYTIIHFPFITLNGIFNAREKFIQLKITEILNRIITLLLIIILVNLIKNG